MAWGAPDGESGATAGVFARARLGDATAAVVMARACASGWAGGVSTTTAPDREYGRDAGGGGNGCAGGQRGLSTNLCPQRR